MRRLLILLVVSLCSAAPLLAQSDDLPLGDLAREVRKSKAPEDKPIIDNDNLSVMMDKAEAERLNGKPVFSIDPGGRTFRMTSPDGTCSLSFDARAAALISSPIVTTDLPQYELNRLQGPAAIRNGVLEVSLYNGSEWEVREIVVGLTIPHDASQSEPGPGKTNATSDTASSPKLADSTKLYHLKATGPPAAITTFRLSLSDNSSDSQDWHWSLVAARGIPPAAPNSVVPESASGPPTLVPASTMIGPSQTPVSNPLSKTDSSPETPPSR